MGNNGNGFISDTAQRRAITDAWNEVCRQRRAGLLITIPDILLTSAGLQRITSMITRSRELDKWELDVLQTWVTAYRKDHS